MNTSEHIIQVLKENDINVFFLVTGGAIVPFINYIDGDYYCFQHEQSAAMAAEGYFRATGKIACICVTSGPGVQNILNGLCGCWYDSVPALFITGNTNTSESLDTIKSKPRQYGFQEMPVVESFSHFTKFSKRITHCDQVDDVLYDCLSVLKTPRYGPCLMDIPVNIQMANWDYNSARVVNYTPLPSLSTFNTFPDSKRPLLVVGAGVRHSNSYSECMKFIEDSKLPFVVSWGAFDLCRTDHTLRVGSHGVYGDRVANFAIQNADLLIIVGSRLDTRQTGKYNLFSKHSKKIMIDIDAEEINKLIESGVNIDESYVCDVKSFFATKCSYDCNEWLDKISTWKNKYSEEPMRTGVYNYLDKFYDTLPDDCIIIPDTGGNLVWTMQTAKLKEDQQLFTNLGNSSMGFALPCAIGAAIGTNKKIICINGDGGFQMNIQELLTVKKYNLDIDIYILNNSGYGIIKQFQDSYFKSNYKATSKNEVFGNTVNFKGIAEAYGVNTLYDIDIPEDQKIYPKLEYGNSLENMSPILDVSGDMIVDTPKPAQPGWK